MAERVNESQIKYIIDYLMKNKHVLRAICVGPKSENMLKVKWAQLAKELNSLGPPVKTVVQWQKVWKYLLNIAIMRTIRNRSRAATKKISSLIPLSMTYGKERQDRISSVIKRQFSVYNNNSIDSNSTDTSKLYLPESHLLQTNDHEMSIELCSLDSSIPSFVGGKSKITVEGIRKLTHLDLLRKYKFLYRKSTDALKNI